MKKARPIAVIVALFGVVLAAAAWQLFLAPTVHGLRQVGELTDLMAYSAALHDYQEQQGRYPLELADAASSVDWFSPIDRWGTPLLYLSDGSYFVLASMGKGGRPDGVNYLALRQLGPRDIQSQYDECRDPEADQIITDQGWYRGCGK